MRSRRHKKRMDFRFSWSEIISSSLDDGTEESEYNFLSSGFARLADPFNQFQPGEMGVFMKLHAQVLLLTLTLILLTACNPQATASTPTTVPTPQATSTLIPTDTPTPFPLGSTENPIQMGLIAVPDSNDQQTAAQTLEDQITTAAGISVKVVLFDNASDLLEKMESGGLQAAWLPPLTYLYAHKAGYANSALMTNHFGVYAYGVQFLVNRNSGFTPYFDQDTLNDTADSTAALPQLDGKRPCFVDPSSLSGYIIPMGFMNAYNLTFQDPVITRTHTAVVRALYIGGICDYGVTFAIYGDPRTAAEIQDQLPDAADQVIVLWQTPPLIPNLNLSYRPDFPVKDQGVINDALFDLIKTDEGRQLLTSASQTDIQALKIGEDNLYVDVRAYFEASGLKLADFLGK